MKKLIILFSLVLVSLLGYCDTLDYYHIYINDSLIAQYNSLSDKPSITLKQSDLKKDDIITVRYGTDHPCVDCIYILNVLIEVKEQNPQVKTTQHFGKLSIPIKDLLYFKNKYGINYYHFNYSVQNKNPLHKYEIYLFKLIID